MTVAKAAPFQSFEQYLLADPSELPEGRYEYGDGELISVMPESLGNGSIAIFIQLALIASGVPFQLIRFGCEVEVPGHPKTRIPDLTLLNQAHLCLLAKRTTITEQMPPPDLIVEVVSPGDEASDNYQRDYHDKPAQYAAIRVLEYWIVDPVRSWIQVGLLTAGVYQFATFQGDEAIASSVCPNLKLTVQQVLQAAL
ncbi:MAG: Uma2 family endonuclease [Synechococcales bacterium]|nr:Uma2 family endonuclease [Synechococcales bacterium]